MANRQEIPFTQELLRKGIHLISLSIPITYIFVSKQFALSVLIPLTLVFLAFDILSKFYEPVRKFIHFIFGKMFRPHEYSKHTLNGATWVLIASVVTILIFPKIIAITSFVILIVSDISAAIYGRKYGKHDLFDKSWEGTTAFIVSAYAVILILGFAFQTPWTYFVAGFAGATLGAFAEAASGVMKLDDNFSIPMSVGFVMWLAGMFAAGIGLPYLNLL